MTTVTNWAGNITFAAQQLHRPTSVEQLQSVVAAARRLRALGTGHSFNDIADCDAEMVTTTSLPATVEIVDDGAAVVVGGGVRYGDVATALHARGLALHNLGSLPHISVAGAVSTGTHGSGVRNGSLATAVRALELVTADGELRTVSRSADPSVFPGVVVALGLLGVVTRVTLAVEPAYDVAQTVYDDLPFAAGLEHFDEVHAAGYSVSYFTTFRRDVFDTVWVKRRAQRAEGVDITAFGARPAVGPRHPVPGVDPVHCTDQGGVPGPWHERLPHFKLAFTPSTGEELQTEYFVARGDATAALRALREIADVIAPVLHISEVRTIASDDLWLSGAHGRDTVGLHFTWVADTPAVLPVVSAVERALAPFAPRPHWGKVFTLAPRDVRAGYERFGDFAALVAEFDPAGTFRNDFVEALLA